MESAWIKFEFTLKKLYIHNKICCKSLRKRSSFITTIILVS